MIASVPTSPNCDCTTTVVQSSACDEICAIIIAHYKEICVPFLEVFTQLNRRYPEILNFMRIDWMILKLYDFCA